MYKEMLPPLPEGEGWGEGVKMKDVFDSLIPTLLAGILACHLTGALCATKSVPDRFVFLGEKELLD